MGEADQRPGLLVVGPYPAWDMEALAAEYRLHKLFEAPDRAAFLRQVAPDVRAIATRGDLGADRQMIEALTRLEMIAVYGVGYDGVDLAAARERGIGVSNTPDVLTGDVADLAIALLLAAYRQIPVGDVHARTGAWSRGPMTLTRRLFGRRVGIVGYGRIGAEIARRLSGFDCEIGYFARNQKADDPNRYFADPVALAAWSEALVVAVAGGAGTRGIVSAAVIDALGPEGVIVNISRGTTIDEPALLGALEQGRIAGAGLDVFLNEPDIDPRFAALTHVVIHPHNGSGTVETRKAMGQLVRDNLAAHFAGKPLLTPVL